MNRESVSACELLAGKIYELFYNGIIISDDVIHYMDTAFSCTDTAALEDILNDESGMEKEPLIELLLFPDESIQAQLESILESFKFEKQDINKVLSLVMKKSPVARFEDPGRHFNFNFNIPEWAAEQFIHRLNISTQAPALVLQAVENHVEQSLKSQVKVKLRNSRFAEIDSKLHFLCNFFKSIDCSDDDFMQILDFILVFLGEIKPDVTIYKALVHRKKSLFKNLQQALKFEKQLENNNMETLLLQGLRMPHISIDHTRKKMNYIDKICISIFGRTEHIEQVHALELNHDNPGIEKIVQVLS